MTQLGSNAPRRLCLLITTGWGIDTVDGVELDSFASGSSVRRLDETGCRDVPTAASVYVVIRAAAGIPHFLPMSSAGRFKGLASVGAIPS